MKAIFNKFILLFIIVPIITAIVSFSSVILYLQNESMFVDWVKIGKPPTGNAVRIIGSSLIQTSSGEFYKFRYYKKDLSKTNWVRLQNPTPTESNPECIKNIKFISLEEFSETHNFSQTHINCEKAGSITITAIDNQGNIFSWQLVRFIPEDIILILFSPFCGGVFGFLVIAFIWIFRYVTFYDS